MFRQLAFILWLIPALLAAQANPAARAAAIARGVMGTSHGMLKSGIREDSVIPVGPAGSPAVWVVTFRPAGFVIVSGAETTSPVLGYSFTSAFPADPSHPLRSWLLPAYAESRAGLKAGQVTKAATDRMVLPLISAQWGQGDPWNRYCPADSTGRRSLAGCVAVAMAQIMEKWQWPPTGYGEVTYTPLLHADYGELSVRFDTTHYLWNGMHDTYPSEPASLLLYHAGAATFMNYDPSLSSTSVDRYAVPALIGNFLYNKGLTFRDRVAMPSADWTRRLRQDLDNGRPLLYAGTTPDGRSSHAFNVDGYRNGDWFHFNWGWNGAGDGWYTLDAMAGGNSAFTTMQGAIFGIQPSEIPLHDRPSATDGAPGDGFARLYWEKPVQSDLSHFNIYRNDQLIAQTADGWFQDDGLINGTKYTYTVTAMYSGQAPGESVAAPAVELTPYTRIEPGYLQDFESGDAGWQLMNLVSGFRIGPSESLGLEGRAGNAAAIRSEGHAAGEQVADCLASPVIFPGQHKYLAISFDYMFRQNPGIDRFSLVWRDYESGKWQEITPLDSTGGYGSWKTVHYYLPKSAGNLPIQVGFLYNDYFGQGFGAAIDNIFIYEVDQPAVPKISLSATDLCEGQMITYTSESTGLVNTWEWDFGEGAEPRYASTSGPHPVVYATGGRKTILLSLNHLDHLALPDTLNIREKPVAAFEFYRRNQEIFFVNKALHAEQLLWDFGDGTTSTSADPLHTYYSKSLFEVTQIAWNGTCSPDTIKSFVDLRSPNGIPGGEIIPALTVWPNPTSGNLTLLWNISSLNPFKIRMVSVTGLVMKEIVCPPGDQFEIDISDFPAGIFILQIASGSLVQNKQIIKVN
jgi:hypothetical protein